MNLEFKVYQLKENSKFGKNIREKEFVIVGEEGDYYKACGIQDENICMLADIKLDEFAYIFPKDDLEIKYDEGAILIYEFDIPQKGLTIDIIENVIRLNS